MAAQLVSNKRGKLNLVCADNFVYTRTNVQGQHTYWKCIEFRREKCSAVAKTKKDETLILNTPQHTHLSNISGRHHYKVKVLTFTHRFQTRSPSVSIDGKV